MASCTVNFYVKNAKGQTVKSRLFEDLLHHLSDRELAKEWYAVGTDPDFLDRVSTQAKFDENGQITFKSLRRITDGLDLSAERELEMLNKDIGEGYYSYADAMSKLQGFNRNSQYNDKYMATIEFDTHRGYHLSVVKKNPANQAALNKLIANRNLLDRIKYYLNKAGVDYTFLEEGETGGGRYSVLNATQTADGLYQLIRVANDENVEANLAEQAGHFAVNALQKSPLVTRLLDLMSAEVQQEILGDSTNGIFNDITAMEAAGKLVGKAIAEGVDNRTAFAGLIKRIVDLAKRVFATLSRDQVLKDKLSAERVAEKIATGFLSSTFMGDVTDVIDTEGKPIQEGPSLNVREYREVLNRMKLQAEEMKTYAGDLVDRFFAMAAQVESKVTDYNAGVNTDLMALEGISESIALMADMLQEEIPALLTSVDFNNITEFNANMVRHAKALRTVRTFITNALALANSINLVIADKDNSKKAILSGNTHMIETQDVTGNRVVRDLNIMNADLIEAVTRVRTVLDTKERDFFLAFCTDTLGAEYINRAARILWSTKKDRKEGKKLLKKENAGPTYVKDILDSLDTDITLFEKAIASASNSSDLIMQIVDKATKLGNKIADDLATADQQELRHLQQELKDLGQDDLSIFCEKGRDGNLTGNFISQYNWGDYESDFEDFRRECIREFRETYPDMSGLTDFQKSVQWQQFYRPKLKVWHRGDGAHPAHSQWSQEEQRWIPSADYTNQQYYSDIAGTPLEGWLNKLMAMKAKLDSRLPEGSTNLYRMPQFKGTFLNKVRNRRLTESTSSAIKGTICQTVRSTFCEDSEDRDFGSELTYNSLEDDIFENELSYEKEKLERLPIFGVNKMPDTSLISTDLFYSMFAYSGMVNSYAALSQLVDTLEVGRQVLSRRKVGGIKTEDEVKDPSRAFARYQKFLDKQVYGINCKRIKIGNIVVSKVAGFFTGLASRIFLGGNVPGGLVNAGTGAIEILKEAFAGEHFTMHDWKVAHIEYNKSLPDNLWSELSGDEVPDNKVALMIQHFNIMNNEKQRQVNWHTDAVSRFRRGWIGLSGDNVFLPYKAGEHYMQSITYLGLASSIKVYDRNGRPISLLNAYKRADLGDGVFALRMAHDSDRYNTLLKIQRGLNKSIEQNNDDYRNGKLTAEEINILRSIDDDFRNADILTLANSIQEAIDEESLFYRNRGDKERYALLKGIADKISANLNSSSPFGAPISLTSEEQQYLDSKGYRLTDLENTLESIRQDMNNLVWNVDSESAFMNKAREINNRMHGIYNNQDKVTLQQTIFGNMLLAMRGYALGLLERRYSQNKYSTALGGESEGSMNTLGKVIALAFTDKGGFKTTMMALTMPVLMGEKTKQRMLEAGFSVNQFYNMRRNFGDLAFISMLALLKMLTKLGPDEKDDEADLVPGLIYYFANRLFREQAAYNLPGVGLDEVQSVTSLVPTGVSVIADIWDLFYLSIGALVSNDETNSTFFYQQSKEGLYEKYDPKWENKLKKMIPYYRSTFVFEHPYDAAKSYQYGRRLKTK